MIQPVPVERRRYRFEAGGWTYGDLDRRQREIAQRAREGGPGALLLSEVAPVITTGRRAPQTDLTAAPERLSGVGISVYPVDRGGLATYHGPGQWVLFAVDRLEALTGDRRGVRKAVEGLLEIAAQAARFYEPSVEIREGAEMGVWSRRGKLAAVGVHIEQGVLLHGLALNARRTPESFFGLRPCGLDAPVDFLFEGRVDALQAEREFEALGDRLIQAAFDRFYPVRSGALPNRAFAGNDVTLSRK